MKKRLAILCYLLWTPFIIFSQSTIKGRVVNAASGEPLAGSSVFINGTSIGMLSEKDGLFELRNIPTGRYELVISSIGYETNVFPFTSEQLPLQLKIEMTIKVKELENVTIEPFVEEGWDKWGMLFTSSFIGNTPNGKNCRIRNKEAIRFRFYKKSNRVTAYTDEPLIIDNRSLGYTIRYQLEQFEVDFSNRFNSFAGYPFFEDMAANRRNLPRRWRDAREKAFNGSMMHFMRSLYSDSLLENGFEVRRMVKSVNLEKQRVAKIFNKAIQEKQNLMRTNGGMIITGTDIGQEDSIDYFNRIMRQKDHIDTYSSYFVTADSISVVAEHNYRVLYFTDYLFITYKNELEDKEYLGFPQPSRKPGYEQSYIYLPNLHPVTIDRKGGYDPPQEIFSMEYWGWIEKIADMLPSDYRLEKF
jgi:hypothetical protein